MNKYKKAVYDIGKILFEGDEDDVWDDYEAGNACELICRKLWNIGLVDIDEKKNTWEASKKLENYIERSNQKCK